MYKTSVGYGVQKGSEVASALDEVIRSAAEGGLWEGIKKKHLEMLGEAKEDCGGGDECQPPVKVLLLFQQIVA